jgi:hypothetical protein
VRTPADQWKLLHACRPDICLHLDRAHHNVFAILFMTTPFLLGLLATATICLAALGCLKCAGCLLKRGTTSRQPGAQHCHVAMASKGSPAQGHAGEAAPSGAAVKPKPAPLSMLASGGAAGCVWERGVMQPLLKNGGSGAVVCDNNW